MKKWSKVLWLISLLGIAVSFTVQAQSKPTLTILPYTGESGGDQETIAILLANQEDIRNAFIVVPSTANFDAIAADIESEGSNLTRDHIISSVKSRVNADFALIIRTEKTGTSKLAIISMVRTGILQQIAGDYQKYNTLRDIRAFLPDIAKRIALAAQIDTALTLPKLTVLPFYTPRNGVETLDADILVQLLTIELANSGKYMVLPWSLIIETIITDMEIPYFGIIDPEKIRSFGQVADIEYVLAGGVLNLGTTNLFMTSIVNTKDGIPLKGGDIEYRVITEDIRLISELSALLLKGKGNADMWIVPPADKDIWRIIGDPIIPNSPQNPPKTLTPDTLVSFVKIPAGIFTMGSPGSEVSRDSDEIQHQVWVDAFYMGKNQITQEEYEAVMGANPSYFKLGALPVEQVSWFDAITYCNTRSIKEGLTSAYTINGEKVTWNQKANGYRLPTEAEWEYTCRAGTATTFNTGDNFTSSDGNYDGSYSYNKNSVGIYRQRTTPVGIFNPNAWGLYDMHGNVYEWCWDLYGSYTSGNETTLNRVIRGGSWYSAPRYLRSANRANVAPNVHAYYVGFRVARNAP